MFQELAVYSCCWFARFAAAVSTGQPVWILIASLLTFNDTIFETFDKFPRVPSRAKQQQNRRFIPIYKAIKRILIVLLQN
jgi:hypothetical protein